MKKYQRPNPYNRFLPYALDIEDDAERYFNEIKQNFMECLKPNIELTRVNRLVINLQKFISLRIWISIFIRGTRLVDQTTLCVANY